MNRSHSKVDHAGFIEELLVSFPEVIASFDQTQVGHLRCEMGEFLRVVETAMDEGLFWAVEKYLRFLEAILDRADSDVENAIEISFIEDFAFGEYSEQRHRAIKERMPKSLLKKVIQHDSRWNCRMTNRRVTMLNDPDADASRLVGWVRRCSVEAQ